MTSPLYTITRGPHSWRFFDDRELIRTLQSGIIDGADLLTERGAALARRIEDHPRFRDELIDDEVMDEAEPDLEVDLTPMIDVTFLLLIFFMTTALIVMYKSLDAPGSRGDKDGATRRLPTRSEVEARYLFVKVRADGAVTIGAQLYVGVASIREGIERAMAAEGKRTIVIEAGAKARHGDVVQVIDAANLAAVDKILFAKKAGEKTR